jgi:exodeoxyribonuclease V alpha subunit
MNKATQFNVDILNTKNLEWSMTDMETIQGKLARAIFQGKGGFAIVSIATTKGNVTVSGIIPQVEIGAIYSVNGEFVNHPQYGKQFKAVSVEVAMPSDFQGAIAILKSIDGIGEIKAHRIATKLGNDCLHKISENPACIVGVSGIGQALANKVAKSIKEKTNKADLDSTLLQFMGPKTLEKAKEEFGAKWLELALAENPYRLVVIPRVTMLKVDSWVLSTKRLAVDSPERCGAIIAETIKNAANWGHTWLEKELAIKQAKSIKLAIQIQDNALLVKGIEKAIQDEMIVEVSCNGVTGIALATLANAESNIANILTNWQKDNCQFGNVEFASSNLNLNEQQKKAVSNAINNRVCVLTGGPGTGKTHTTKSIIAAMYGADVQVLAPTGKAAKRASQLTGNEAMTIHRFIGNVKAGNIPVAKIIIVDEASMVNVTLMSQLLTIINNNRNDARIVIVGDVDQLPAIEAGNVLGDIIESDKIPVVRLTQIMRQTEGSKIISNAAAINAGNGNECTNGTDFEIVTNADCDFLKNRILDALKEAVSNGLSIYGDIQVLVGQKNSSLGANTLNETIRNAYNPASTTDKEEYLDRKGNSLFRVGDKVMCIENDYNLGVVNGDQGIVKSIKIEDDNATITVTIDSKEVEFTNDNISMLIQAWAITVHRSQGSEYRFVLYVMHSKEMPWGIQRALAYTAVTRGKDEVKVFGMNGDLDKASKSPAKDRLTRLVGLLK